MEIFKGLVVGYVTVLRVSRITNNGGATWVCQCVCGRQTVIQGKYLRSEPTVNCGCQGARLRSERVKSHGCSVKGAETKEYRAWKSMKSRCLSPTNTEYANYGGRGITVCEEWIESFESFLADMGKCPDGYTLDREKVNEGYSKGNCRWLSFGDQQRNKRNTVWVEWQGKTVQLRALAEKFGLPRSRVYQQWKRKVPLENIFQPPMSK